MAARSTSRSTTSIPACAATSAISAPITPAPTTPSALSRAPRPQQVAGDHQALDLAGALVDLGDLRVAVVGARRGTRPSSRSPRGSARRNRPPRPRRRSRRASPLRPTADMRSRRRRAALRRAGQQARRVELRRPRRRSGTGRPGSGRSGRRMPCAPGRRRRPGRVRRRAMPQAWAAIVMRPPSRVESASFSPSPSRPEQRVGADAKAVEGQLHGGGGVQAHLRDLAANLEARRRARPRRRSTPSAPGPPVRAKTMKTSAKPPLVIQLLGAARSPNRAVGSRRGGAQRRRVRAGVGLGEGVGAEDLAAREARQPAPSARRCRGSQERRRHQAVLHGDRRRGPRVGARDLLDDRRERRGVEAGAAEVLGHRSRRAGRARPCAG